MKNKKKRIDQQRKNDKILFSEILDHYGHKCICGSIEHLVVDHIGGKNKIPCKRQTGDTLWRYLKKNNFPPGFRILCHSCNIIDGFLRKNKNLRINGIDDLIKLRDIVRR